jgi:hypothetical protein
LIDAKTSMVFCLGQTVSGRIVWRMLANLDCHKLSGMISNVSLPGELLLSMTNPSLPKFLTGSLKAPCKNK